MIAKIIAQRLGLVLDHLISSNQSAFVKGHNMNEAILLAHELVRVFSNKMGSRACIN